MISILFTNVLYFLKALVNNPLPRTTLFKWRFLIYWVPTAVGEFLKRNRFEVFFRLAILGNIIFHLKNFPLIIEVELYMIHQNSHLHNWNKNRYLSSQIFERNFYTQFVLFLVFMIFWIKCTKTKLSWLSKYLVD